MKTIRKKMLRISGVLLVAFATCLTSCSDDDDAKELSSAELIQQYALPGTYSIQISSSFMGNTPISAGTHQAVLTDEGNGVLRLKFGGFNTPPMPFVMAVDARMTLSSSGQQLIVHNVNGKSFFDADVPPGQTLNPDNLPPGLDLPAEALQNGLHSNGNSTISGTYQLAGEEVQFDLTLDPAVGLPVVISITALEKLD